MITVFCLIPCPSLLASSSHSQPETREKQRGVMYPSDGHRGGRQGQERAQPLEGLEWGPGRMLAPASCRCTSVPHFSLSISFCPLVIYFFGHTMQHLSSLTRDRIHVPCSGHTESKPLDLRKDPRKL